MEEGYPSEIIKSNKFGLYSSTVQQLAPLSITSCITAAFVLASGHPGHEVNTLYSKVHRKCCRRSMHRTIYARHVN